MKLTNFTVIKLDFGSIRTSHRTRCGFWKDFGSIRTHDPRQVHNLVGALDNKFSRFDLELESQMSLAYRLPV